MINRNKIAASTLAAIGLIAIVMGSSAIAAGFDEVAPQHDVNLCVSEIGNQADYTGAVRVRHEVESTKRRTVGYSLAIKTTVFAENDGEAVREYKAMCVVAGGETPLRFKIRAVGDNA